MNPGSDSIKVLHVDDDAAVAEMTAEMLEREHPDLDVVPENDPEAAVDSVSDGEFDCVVSDYEMPEMDGLQLLEEVRERYEDLPFILYTGKGSEEIASDAISAGVTDYLQKEAGSQQYELLANRVVNAVEARRSRQRSSQRKRRLEMLIENIEGVVYRCRHERGWPIEFLQGDVEEIFGVPQEHADNLAGLDAESSIHPDDRDRVWRETEEALSRREEPFDLEYRLVDGRGEIRWVRDRTHAVRDGDGEVVEIEGLITDFTEEKLRRRKFEEVFDNTYQFTGLAEPDGTLVEVNEAALDFGGLDQEDVVGDVVWETQWFQGDGDADEVVKEGVEEAAEGEMYRDEMTVEDDDGEIAVDYSARPIEDEAGEISLVVLEGRDITDLIDRERQLQRSRDLLRHTEELADTGGWEIDVESEEVTWTEGARSLHDVEEDVSLEQAVELYHPDDANVIEDVVERCIEEGLPFDEDLRITSCGDGTRWVRARGEPVYSDGEVVKITGAIQDVTEHREREHQLEQERAFIDSVIEAIPDVLYAFDTELQPLRWNERALEVTGYSEQEIQKKTATEFVPSGEREKIHEHIQHVFEGEGSVTVESYLETKDCDRIPYELTGALIEDDSGEPVGFTGIGRDITDRRSRQKELRRRNQQLEAIMEAADAAIFVKDREGMYVILDEVAREVADVEEVEDAELTDHDIFPEDVAEQAREEDQQVVETGEPLQVEKEMPTAEGSRTHLVKKTPLKDDDGVIHGVCGVSTDVTEVKEYERRLEEFAEMVSHDLQNPLMVARGNLDLAREDVDSDYLDKVDGALERLDELTGDVLEIARHSGEVEKTGDVHLQELAREAWSNVDTGEAERQFDCDGVVDCDQDGLKRLLENLYSNAVEHGSRREDAGDLTVYTRLFDGGFVVEDDGQGVSDDVEDELFERGFSGSEDGTGFGLNIVKSICDAHGWTVELEESEEGGARFVVTGVELSSGN